MQQHFSDVLFSRFYYKSHIYLSYKDLVTSCIPAITEGWTEQVLWQAHVIQWNKINLTSKNEKYFEKLSEISRNHQLK